MKPLLVLALVTALPLAAQQQSQQPLLTGQAAFTDWNQEAPGVRHKITVADLPEPNPDESVTNGPKVIPRPADAWPQAPAGFKVTLYAGGDTTFNTPRLIRSAPNGDLFLSDSQTGDIWVLRGTETHGKVATLEKFASGLDHPFGINFWPTADPKFVYVANTTSVVRFPYKSGDLHASGPAETIVGELPGRPHVVTGHWTRDVVFGKDGRMLISVGSGSNINDPDTDPKEFHRADVLAFTPEGKFLSVYASGIRNCVGEAINPITGQLWCSTNERDVLGNHLVPDYVTSVPEGSFFGWPWYYMGGHLDPRRDNPCAAGSGPNQQLAQSLTPEQSKDCKREDIHAKVRTPDVLMQPHMASLEMTFYPAATIWTGDPNHVPSGNHLTSKFPQTYWGGAFAAEHGSWNRAARTGYEVAYIPVRNGQATGEYDDFLTGFVTKDGQVWGRPVGVTVANDGSLFVVDDGSKSVWHITYTGK